MNHIQRTNLDGFLAWQEKYRRDWAQVPAWSATELSHQAHIREAKLATARAWLANREAQRRSSSTLRVRLISSARSRSIRSYMK